MEILHLIPYTVVWCYSSCESLRHTILWCPTSPSHWSFAQWPSSSDHPMSQTTHCRPAPTYVDDAIGMCTANFRPWAQYQGKTVGAVFQGQKPEPFSDQGYSKSYSHVLANTMRHPLLVDGQPNWARQRLPIHCRRLRSLQHHTVIPVATRMSFPLFAYPLFKPAWFYRTKRQTITSQGGEGGTWAPKLGKKMCVASLFPLKDAKGWPVQNFLGTQPLKLMKFGWPIAISRRLVSDWSPIDTD